MSQNPRKYKLSPELLDQMIQHDYDKVYKQYKNQYDDFPNRRAPREQYRDLQNAVYDLLSSPLKLAHETILKNSLKKCYKDKHMDLENTNLEQIKLCKDIEHDKVLGKFYESLYKHRDSDWLNLQECIPREDDVNRYLKCMDQHFEDIKTSNVRIAEEFRANSPQYF